MYLTIIIVSLLAFVLATDAIAAAKAVAIAKAKASACTGRCCRCREATKDEAL